jgi:hypothetical protein
MNVIRGVMAEVKYGIAFVVVAVAIALVAEAVWGEVYGRYDWRVIAIAIMGFGIILLTGLEEFLRPQNPYKNLDPRFAFQDRGPTGQIHSSTTSLLWNIVPPALACVLLIVTLTR